MPTNEPIDLSVSAGYNGEEDLTVTVDIRYQACKLRHQWPTTKLGSLAIAVGAYDVGKLNLELEVRMISVFIQLGFEDQSDTDILLCKVFIKISIG
ncbi:hypothetical protein HID58_044485 [Brassica napus]|uniref:Uncharacterized protein n=1 Tax=Brassica napus TaxID=3708 RepID=A0ABQ7XKP4_BRANA|nr:hypothetical protein HID58_084770 [Brassica napus]KAH0862837.1 hypothetical protein HID58_080048 [Brassica napus]KAH0904982.1 hypothetical protein HID58_044485 [Brassica napus]